MATLTTDWFNRMAGGPDAEAAPYSRADEEFLAQRALDGDLDAFAELVRRHQKAVFNVALRMTGNRRDAEDVTQEAFLRALDAFDRFDPSRPMAPWIKRIAVNLCLNRWESARIRLNVQASDLTRRGQAPVDLDSWAAHTPTPEQALVAGEREEAVRAAILELPLHYRAVIELRHYQGLSYDEIGQTLDRSLSNVKSDLFRARKMLARLLQGRI